MKKIQIIIGALISFVVYACSPDDISSEPILQATKKKLIKMTYQNNNEDWEIYFNYNTDNKVSSIKSIQKIDPANSWFKNKVYNYKNGLIVSSSEYYTDQLVETHTYKYVNNNLTEIITYDKNENITQRRELTYNSENRIRTIYREYVNNIYNYFYTYDTNGNVVKMQANDYYTLWKYDTYPKPDSYFSYANQYIFNIDNSFNINKNNPVDLTWIHEGETVVYATTSITYDADNYPIKKITVPIYADDGTIGNIRTWTYEYE